MYGDSAVIGHGVQGTVPEWRPLVEAVGEDLAGTFMWMFEVRLSDGRPLHAYKPIDTSTSARPTTGESDSRTPWRRLSARGGSA
jgi:hypothetical protein